MVAKIGFPALDPLISHERSKTELDYLQYQVAAKGYNPQYQIYPKHDDSIVNLNKDHWGPKTINHRNKVGGYRIDKKELVSASCNFDNLRRKKMGASLLEMSNSNSPRGTDRMKNSLDSPSKFFMT